MKDQFHFDGSPTAVVQKPLALLGVGLCATTLAVMSPRTAAAQDQVWSSVTANGPVATDSRWLVWFDGHARFREGGETLDTTILRPGVGYRVNNRLDVWVGYANVTNRRPGLDVEEHRLWQQATYPIAQVAGGSLTGRTRLEQRFRDGDDDTGLRLRQFVRWSRPLGGVPLSAVVSNETFFALNDTDWGQRGGFDQNRAFVGLAWAVSPKVRIEGGYLNQQIDGGPAPDTSNDNLSLAAFASF
ncbi:DUF2490 domain-containing protein [Brevundimonas sp.]|uniref:DUF2490 domain-containing protein n=1 Tax=Brevundimonas sp. TaxID=1871086 RepID=UPI003D09CD78